ncbi:aminoglycoside phosphotransferase family protein [Devosia insulae]|nr:aminoglycoside phosphotransferase family protein [Devosia insulae]
MATLLNPTPDATMLSRALARWSLTRPTLIAETATSLVYRVERTGQPPAVLKLLKPGSGEDERNGGSLLVWYAGNGAAAIYGLARDAVLMELADGETLGDVARVGRDAEATEILCDTVAKLHAPRDAAPPAGLEPLRERFEALFRVGAAAWPRQARDLVGRATGIAYNLFDKPMEIIPLHGDIHHDNIVSGARGWVAIDPKGLIGDPAYDYANSFLNPEEGDDFVISASRVARHSHAIAARTGIPRRHLLAWASAHAALSAAWDIEDGNPVTQQISILPLLLGAYDTA